MALRSKKRQSKIRKKPALPKAGTQNQADYSTQSQHEILALRIAEERQQTLVDKFSGNDAEGKYRKFFELMEESYGMFNTMIDELTLNPPLACKRGCIYCCINQVSLTEPEALYLGFHLLENRSLKQLQDLKIKTQALLTELKGKNRQQIGMERHLHPCLFMEDGTCSIYPARPFVCRGWNSVNAEMCKHSNQTGDALAPIENHPLPRILADSIQLGLLNGAKGIGLEAGYLLLARAVSMLLEGGADRVVELTQDWLEGRPLFAKA
ncbi:YkgJ family cysteine cluster protein [Maridesulfovibrio sp.]|uniref:YkgJ family cysteine cluster protein n=1 Tax=Maridesulfovibrio sp. TaxID=2795000 RepID=UPI0039F090F0